MATLSLYVDNEESTGAWTTAGTTPYLGTQNQPTAYIYSTGRNADSGVYSFQGTAQTGTINYVRIYYYAYGVATTNFAIILSGSNLGNSAPAGSWQWLYVDVSAILNTWDAINATTIYFDRPNTTNDAGVDCAYLYVDYTSSTVHYQTIEGTLVSTGIVTKQSVFTRTVTGIFIPTGRIIKGMFKKVGC